jgi:hypothetical protein
VPGFVAATYALCSVALSTANDSACSIESPKLPADAEIIKANKADPATMSASVPK